MQKNKLLSDFSIFLTKGKAKTASKVCFVNTLYTPTEDYDIKISYQSCIISLKSRTFAPHYGRYNNNVHG